MENLEAPYCISPIDGRYASQTKNLKLIFSEFGLMKARLIVEILYLIDLISFLGRKRVRQFTEKELDLLRDLYENFSDEGFKKIKCFEAETRHDVKAVEYFLRHKLAEAGLGNHYSRYVHLGRTSEDINNLAYALILKYGTEILLENCKEVSEKIRLFAEANRDVPMLALTHGQPATPTTVGWTMIVYHKRLQRIITERLEKFRLLVKFNGATGGDNALCVAYPDKDWRKFSRSFVRKFEAVEFIKGMKGQMKLEINYYTFQIEPHDTYKELFEIITSLNTICIGFNMNMHMDIMLENFLQKTVSGEVGSSAMPQKINPIDFENSEGNFGFANSSLKYFSDKLPITRGYRDLSDSTVERNFGVPYSHILIALKSLIKGMNRITVNEVEINAKLDQSWGIIAEAYQIILRVNGVERGYEIVAEEVKGKKVTRESMHSFVDRVSITHNLAPKVVEQMKAITPFNYLGDRSWK